MAETTPDALLIARAAKGGQRSFEQLYRAHVNRVHGLCLRMTRDPTLAEDCTQMTFIQAWRALPKFEQRSAFGTWLHRIAVNQMPGQRRRRGDAPVEVAEIEAAIAALPEGARDALVLSGICGYSHLETAAMLGLAEGTCRAQLHRSRPACC